jgi:hypothetical protein
MLFFFHACCDPCNDPNLVKPSLSVLSAPEITLAVSNAVAHSNGTATSSISIAENNSEVNFSLADSVTTNLEITATDTLIGIQCITVNGSFNFNFISFGDTIFNNGAIPEIQNCTSLTNCCLKSKILKVNDLKNQLRCRMGGYTNEGKLNYYIFVKTCNNGIDTVMINFKGNG